VLDDIEILGESVIAIQARVRITCEPALDIHRRDWIGDNGNAMSCARPDPEAARVAMSR